MTSVAGTSFVKWQTCPNIICRGLLSGVGCPSIPSRSREQPSCIPGCAATVLCLQDCDTKSSALHLSIMPLPSCSRRGPCGQQQWASSFPDRWGLTSGELQRLLQGNLQDPHLQRGFWEAAGEVLGSPERFREVSGSLSPSQCTQELSPTQQPPRR